jgi:hypothetical protein
MKTALSLSSILLIAICFTSCTKTIEISTPPPSHSVSGSWYVSNASYLGNNGWYNFDAGLPGVFTFYNDGAAQYEDNIGTMQGDWYSNIITTSYYDEYGNYQTNSHNDFSVSVSDNSGYINLAFDDISFAGNNQFIATYYDGKSIQRYTFTRY